MRILTVNKFYFINGGAETVCFNTAKLLRGKGHTVSFFSMKDPRNFPTNDEKYFIENVNYENGSFGNKLSVSLKLLYSIEAKNKLRILLNDNSPDIAHLHNIYHQISPSVLHVFKKMNIPTVMTLHDYKLVCASYFMLKRSIICEACGFGQYYNCFKGKCVRDSYFKSLLNTLEMYLHHNILHIYNLVDLFISPSVFLKDKLAEKGFTGKIVYLPNFVKAEEFKPQYNGEENTFVYFGRLLKEKGIHTLIKAVEGLNIKLNILGEGQFKKHLMDEAKRNNTEHKVNFLGYKQGEQLHNEIRRSIAVIVPSEWYENNPLSILEAFALGKPVIGARIGGIPELVKNNETGLTFQPGNADDLRLRIEDLANNLDKAITMGRNARAFVEQELNEDKHYKTLLKIYEQVINKSI